MKTLLHGKAIDLAAFDAHLLAVGKAAFREEIGAFVCGQVDRAGAPVCRISQGHECLCEIVVKAVLDAAAEAARRKLG